MRRGEALLVWMLGCTANAPTEAPKPLKTCDAGFEVVGDACIARLERCAEGEVAKLGGGCLRVGVPECAPGFQKDAEGGCVAILPMAPCEVGKIAVPGDATCRELTACGAEPWGDIPVDATTLYVNGSAGVGGDGSSAKPFKTINEAVAVATSGKTIAVAAGRYSEAIRLPRAIKLHGRCASMVEVAGDGTATSIIEVSGAAEIRGIALTGSGTGILGYNTKGIVIESTWLHDLTERAIDIEGPSKDTAAVVRNVLIQRASRVSIFSLAADVTIEKSAVHDTQLLGGTGMGVLAQLDTRNGKPSSVQVRGSLIAGAIEGGVVASASRVTVDGCAIRDIRGPSTTKPGPGIGAQYDAKTKSPAEVVVRSSTIERAEGVAVDAIGSNLMLERVDLRDTLAKQKTFGVAIEVTKGSTLTVTDSIIRRVRTAAVNIRGSRATLERTSIRDVFPQESDAMFGLAISIAPDDPTQFLSEAILRDVAIDRVQTFGIGVYGSKADLERVSLRDILAQKGDGRFGDGIAMTAFEVTPGDGESAIPSSVTLDGVIVDKAARAGALVAGSNVAAHASIFSCSAFPLDVGSWFSTFAGTHVVHDFALDDRGGNGCGCGTLSACRAGSNDLEPTKPGVR